MKDLTFGSFINQKRKEKQLSARQLAAQLGVSAMYISSIQSDRKAPPTKELLERICYILEIEDEEKELCYDLAAKGRNEVSQDLPQYIMDKEIVRTALRTAKEHDVDDKEWLEFIERISRKGREAE